MCACGRPHRAAPTRSPKQCRTTAGASPPPYRMRFSWRTTTRRAHCPALHGTYFVGAGPRPARLIYTLEPRIFISWGCFAAPAASDFCHGAKVTKKPLRGRGVSIPPSPWRTPTPHRPIRGASAPLLDVPPRGRRTGDEGQRENVGRGRFSWRLTVPTPFAPLGHSPLTGGIGLGRRRGRARRVVAPHANNLRCLSSRAPEGRRVKDAAPCRFASFDTYRTTWEHQWRRV